MSVLGNQTLATCFGSPPAAGRILEAVDPSEPSKQSLALAETSGKVMTCHACGSSGVTGHSPGNEIELASCRRVMWSRGRGRGRGQSNAGGRSHLLWAAVFAALLTTGASGTATAGTGRLRGLAARLGSYDTATFRPEGIRRGARGQNAASIAGYEETEQPSMIETAISSARGAIEQVRNGCGPGMHRPPGNIFGLPPPPSSCLSLPSVPISLSHARSQPPPSNVCASIRILPSKAAAGFRIYSRPHQWSPQSNHKRCPT
jgi:hypothetical protein